MRFRVYVILILAIILGAFAVYSQEVIVKLTPSDGSAATMINAQIAADTVGHGFSASRIYEMERDQYYLQNAILTVPSRQTLRIRAAAGVGAKPILYLWESGSGATPTRPPGNSVVLNGGNLEIKNICIAGYYEPETDRIGGVQGGLINTTGAGSSIILDGVILSNINGQHVRTGSNSVKVQVTNSIFANMGALSTSNLGAGKGFDLRDVSCDSFIVLNNTFVNFQDRAIRHYNFATPTAGTGAIKYGRIEHNSFVNGMGFHGLFSLGSVGSNIIITNNLFLDAFALGEDSTDATRAAEWANTGEVYANGNNRITWIFTSPNDTTKWKVSNNYYAISNSGMAFLNDFGFPPANPLSAHIMSRLGAAAASAFTQTTLTPVNVPRLMTNMMRWYEDPVWGAGKKKEQTNFVIARDDYDRRVIEFYRDSLDVSYPVSAAAYAGGEGGLPVGDLNWFPAKKAVWENNQNATPIVNVRVDANNDFIADLKGQTVTISGIVTTPNYRPGGMQYYMQDATAGINIFASSIPTPLKPGDVVTITGKIDQYNGLVEIIPQKAEDIIILGTQAVPDPIPCTKADLNEATEGMLVQLFRYKVVDAAIWPAAGKNATVKFTNGSDTVDVYIDKDVDIAGTIAPAGWTNLVGTCEQFSTAALPNSGYEVRPRGVADFVLITGVEANSALPIHFALGQNYPNPFNPTTTISFSLEKSGHATLTVLNLLGQEVIKLVDKNLSAGSHLVHFDAAKLSSGVYLYKLESNGEQSIRKMMLMR